MKKRKVKELRDLVDDLYDMIINPTHDMSKQYLLINEKIDEIIAYEDGYITNADPNDDELVHELMSSEIGADPTKWGERRIY